MSSWGSRRAGHQVMLCVCFNLQGDDDERRRGALLSHFEFHRRGGTSHLNDTCALTLFPAFTRVRLALSTLLLRHLGQVRTRPSELHETCRAKARASRRSGWRMPQGKAQASSWWRACRQPRHMDSSEHSKRGACAFQDPPAVCVQAHAPNVRGQRQRFS